ncbi:AAA ATPase domain-containing protein [Burkholderia sp. D7]|nr:AAA ATPase domain-containing protein [Burkholderia sp. D7]
MRLVRFKVTNFRSVVDSGWLDAEQVTALVGVNESGKTNLLLPLWKLNPAREGDIQPTSDYPKSNYAAIRENPRGFTFVTAEFDCVEIAAKLEALTSVAHHELTVVQVSRAFDGSYKIDFPRHSPISAVKGEEVADLISRVASEVEGSASLGKEGTLKDLLLGSLREAKAEVEGITELSVATVSKVVGQLREVVPETPAPTSSIVPPYLRLIESLSEIEAKLSAPLPVAVAGVQDLVIDNLPRFVFYSNYGNLDSEIYLPHVVENLKRTDLGARDAAKARTLRVLFSFVRLEPEEILELGRDFRDQPNRAPSESEISQIANKKRERTILLNSAGTDLTKKFGAWWKQGDYTFEFQADGDHFRIWVSDKRRPEKVELEDRSSGLQWFLSFYLVFLVESTRDHRDAILLLDEPGLSLHPLAQRDLSAFFDGLSQTNQLIYTTHSPFLVDADMLDRARKVYVADDGSTKVSSDLRRGNEDPRKSGATYAIYSALNMNVAESLLLGCCPIIVEGPSDQHYLATIKSLLIGSGRINPKRELVFPPSHGARNAKVIASILTGRDEILPFMLLDGDDAGERMAKDMQNGLYQEAKDRVLTTDKYVGFAGSEIEDLFPPAFFADAIDRWERRPETAFSDVLVAGRPVVPQIEAWAAAQGVTLVDGWKVEVSREVKRRALAAGVKKFDEDTLGRWSQLFNDLGSAE